MFVGLIAWCKAFTVVAAPFLKLVAIWVTWQLGIGGLAWTTARFYSINCAPPGVTGFFASLFAMGNPICVSAWFSHGAFVVAYIASFVAALLIAMIWIWKQSTAYPMIQKLRREIKDLKAEYGQSNGTQSNGTQSAVRQSTTGSPMRLNSDKKHV